MRACLWRCCQSSSESCCASDVIRAGVQVCAGRVTQLPQRMQCSFPYVSQGVIATKGMLLCRGRVCGAAEQPHRPRATGRPPPAREVRLTVDDSVCNSVTEKHAYEGQQVWARGGAYVERMRFGRAPCGTRARSRPALEVLVRRVWHRDARALLAAALRSMRGGGSSGVRRGN